MTVLCLTMLASYLVGAIPFGYLVARWRGVDILRQGSGNIGATNIGRVLGRRFGFLVFLFDFAKGAGPVIAATWLAQPDDFLGKDGVRVGAGLAAFLGHLFPVYLRFRGGKGVATGAGVVAILVPGPAIGAFLLWATMLCSTRYMSLASLSAAAALCGLRLTLTPHPFSAEHRTLTVFCFVAAALVAVRHSANIGRLIHGTENRVRDSDALFLLGKIIHVLALGLWFGSAIFFFLATLVLLTAFDSQTAGSFAQPIFPLYFPLLTACGVLASIPALDWWLSEPHVRVHKIRVLVLVLGLVTVIAGWPVFLFLKGLRLDRVSADWELAARMKEVFELWHTFSLLLNFGTMILVTVAMALAALLPQRADPSDGDQPADATATPT